MFVIVPGTPSEVRSILRKAMRQLEWHDVALTARIEFNEYTWHLHESNQQLS